MLNAENVKKITLEGAEVIEKRKEKFIASRHFQACFREEMKKALWDIKKAAKEGRTSNRIVIDLNRFLGEGIKNRSTYSGAYTGAADALHEKLYKVANQLGRVGNDGLSYIFCDALKEELVKKGYRVGFDPKNDYQLENQKFGDDDYSTFFRYYDFFAFMRVSWGDAVYETIEGKIIMLDGKIGYEGCDKNGNRVNSKYLEELFDEMQWYPDTYEIEVEFTARKKV